MSGGSKGGHFAKDDEESYKKHMITVENHDMDSRTIIDVIRDQRHNAELESGVEFTIKIVRNVYPGESVFAYPTEDERDQRYQKLKSKMQVAGVIFV